MHFSPSCRGYLLLLALCTLLGVINAGPAGKETAQLAQGTAAPADPPADPNALPPDASPTTDSPALATTPANNAPGSPTTTDAPLSTNGTGMNATASLIPISRGPISTMPAIRSPAASSTPTASNNVTSGIPSTPIPPVGGYIIGAGAAFAALLDLMGGYKIMAYTGFITGLLAFGIISLAIVLAAEEHATLSQSLTWANVAIVLVVGILGGFCFLHPRKLQWHLRAHDMLGAALGGCAFATWVCCWQTVSVLGGRAAIIALFSLAPAIESIRPTIVHRYLIIVCCAMTGAFFVIFGLDTFVASGMTISVTAVFGMPSSPSFPSMSLGLTLELVAVGLLFAIGSVYQALMLRQHMRHRVDDAAILEASKLPEQNPWRIDLPSLSPRKPKEISELPFDPALLSEKLAPLSANGEPGKDALAAATTGSSSASDVVSNRAKSVMEEARKYYKGKRPLSISEGSGTSSTSCPSSSRNSSTQEVPQVRSRRQPVPYPPQFAFNSCYFPPNPQHFEPMRQYRPSPQQMRQRWNGIYSPSSYYGSPQANTRSPNPFVPSPFPSPLHERSTFVTSTERRTTEMKDAEGSGREGHAII